jgi:hypothetical protein
MPNNIAFVFCSFYLLIRLIFLERGEQPVQFTGITDFSPFLYVFLKLKLL